MRHAVPAPIPELPSVPPAVAALARAARAAVLADQGFDATCVWVVGEDAPGAVVEWPESAERLYRVGAAAVVGRARHEPVGTAPVGADWPAVIGALRQAGRWEGELAHVHPSGRRVQTDTRLVLVPATHPTTRPPRAGASSSRSPAT
jgi:hypothetical protein